MARAQMPGPIYNAFNLSLGVMKGLAMLGLERRLHRG